MNFGELFSMDNAIWKYLERLWDAIWLTVLWAVFSLPVVTAGASTAALFDVAGRIIRDEEGKVTRQFAAAFRRNFRQATVIWLIMAAIGGILFANLRFYSKMDNSFGKTYMIVLLVFCGIYLMLLHYIFAVLARFDNSIKNLFVLSFLLSVKNFGWTLLMITISFCIAAIGIFVFSGLLATGVGLAALLDSWILEPVFEKVIENMDCRAL